MRTRRKLMGSIGSVAAISIGGCLDSGSSSGGTESDSGSNTGDSSSEQEDPDVEYLRSKYVEALNHNETARNNLQQALGEINNDNLETADTHISTAFQEFKDGRSAYGGLFPSDTHMKVFDVDNENNLPDVHDNAVEANQKGEQVSLEIIDNLDYRNDEKPSSDRIDEIATNLEEGEYTVPPIEEFDQALP